MLVSFFGVEVTSKKGVGWWEHVSCKQKGHIICVQDERCVIPPQITWIFQSLIYPSIDLDLLC